MSNLKISNLHFSYTDEFVVLQGIDLQLQEETTAIVGQNGAGKTTFVKLLKGLLQPNRGEILLDGNPIANFTAATLAKFIGLVFQNPNDQIFKNKVINEVMFGPLNIGKGEEVARENAIKALRQVGLENDQENNPYDMSLSERKLVTIASVLAMDAEVIIFDEPTMGQDEAGKETIKGIIYDLKKQGKLVLCILHDMDFAAAVFDRTIVFNQGKVLLDGATRDVFSNASILEAAYLKQPHIMEIAKQLGSRKTILTETELVRELQ